MRLILALWVGKIIGLAIKLAKSGGGSAGPGYYALKICPTLVKELAKQIPQNIVITGTNGKTTTARMLAHFTKAAHGSQQNIKIIRNATGSNLQRGIASALISQASWSGKIDAELGIWELDEAAFNKTVFEIKPQIIVFLNAFRDQLDRYGEVDSVVKKWFFSLGEIDWKCTFIVNRSDSNTASLVVAADDNQMLEAETFQVKNHFLYREVVVDAKKEIKPFKAHFEVDKVKNLGLKGTEFVLNYPGGKLPIYLHIPGVYHIYDFLAAFCIYYQLNMPVDSIQKSLESFSPAFGRVEQINLNGKDGFIFLIKNPAGTNQVLETITPELKEGDKLLIALNDNFADGKDVSWIWDAGFENLSSSHPELISSHPELASQSKRKQILSKKTKNKVQSGISIICSGTRAQDLAIRLKYAGMDEKTLTVQNDLKTALSGASSHTTGRIFILPTYTALLELQRILAKMGVKKHYWKEES